jgi:hypothetical protein
MNAYMTCVQGRKLAKNDGMGGIAEIAEIAEIAVIAGIAVIAEIGKARRTAKDPCFKAAFYSCRF